MLRAAAMLAASVLLWASPAFAQSVDVGPTWSSDRVCSARGETLEPALAFDVRQETTAPGAAPKVETSHVVLSPDFTYVSSGRTHTLDDFALRRMFFWSDGAASFTILNGHALPAFRVMELANRRTLDAMLSRLATTSGKSVGPTHEEPYWREAELGVSDPPDAPLTLRKTATGTDFLLGDDTVVRTEGRAYDLLPADRRPLTRYLALHTPLHPQTRHALVDGGILPARMIVELYRGAVKQTVAFTVSGAAREPLAYPLPAGLSSNIETAFAPPGSSTATGVRAAVEAIGGRFGTPKPTPDEMIGALRKAAAGGRPMEVWLWFSAFTQQYGYKLTGGQGPQLSQTLVTLVRPALKDPQVARFYQANALAGAPATGTGDREAAARYLASAKALDALPFGTFRYVTFANLVVGSKDFAGWDKAIFSAMPSPLVANYWTHIAAYPWASNAYKDAGTTYLTAFDTPKAWMTFDLGRAVDPDWRSGAMGSIANYEAALEANAPDFF